jgi:adenylate kinase
MTRKLAVFGGCSNAGKTTIIGELSKRYGLEQAKKFELIKNEAAKRGMPEDKLFKNFLELEMAALKSLGYSSADKPFLLDSHYAIQPQIDDSIARGIIPQTRIEEPYVLSFGEDTLRDLAKNYPVNLFYIYLDMEEILDRRVRNMRSYYIPQRSLDRDNIAEEIANEHKMFLKMYGLLESFGASVRKHEIENKNGELEDRISEIANLLNLGGIKNE